MIFADKVYKKYNENKETPSKTAHNKIVRLTSVLALKLKNSDNAANVNAALTILSEALTLASNGENDQANRLYTVAKRVSRF